MATLFEPGVQGPEAAGSHGWGVSTPPAADVADATRGLLVEEHIPNGARLISGRMS
jgi:hypothetical protein